jgi:hypothetical protein
MRVTSSRGALLLRWEGRAYNNMALRESESA